MHAWERSDGGGGKIRIWRIFNVASLLIAAVALILAYQKPAPVAQSQAPAALSASALSFQAKVDQLEQAQPHGATVGEVRLTGEEVGAALAQAMGSAVPAPQVQPASTSGSTDVAAPIAPGNVDVSSLGEPVVTFERDKVIGQFVTEVAGKKVYITIAGHLGAKNGYVTFDPTEFKFGDLNVPVSLVNEALQKKMLEQRDRLKLPDFVSDLRVENGQLVITKK
jgi:hypothetical protein